jgi:hypothetical protein
MNRSALVRSPSNVSGGLPHSLRVGGFCAAGAAAGCAPPAGGWPPPPPPAGGWPPPPPPAGGWPPPPPPAGGWPPPPPPGGGWPPPPPPGGGLAGCGAAGGASGGGAGGSGGGGGWPILALASTCANLGGAVWVAMVGSIGEWRMLRVVGSSSFSEVESSLGVSGSVSGDGGR